MVRCQDIVCPYCDVAQGEGFEVVELESELGLERLDEEEKAVGWLNWRLW